MKALTNAAQLKPPAGQNLPYTPSCFQLHPSPSEAGIGWGPKLDGQTVSVWLTLPATYDVVGEPNAYKTLEEYGLCVRNGQEVPFVKVEQSTARENPLAPPPEFLPKQNAEAQAPRNIFSLPPEYSQQPSTPAAPAGDQGLGPVMGFAIGAFILGRIGYHFYVNSQQPQYQELYEEDLSEEIYEEEQMVVPVPSALPALASVRHEPSPWGRTPETLTQQGFSTEKSAAIDLKIGCNLTENRTENALQSTEISEIAPAIDLKTAATELQLSATFSAASEISPEIQAKSAAMFSSIRSRLNQTLLLDVDESPSESSSDDTRYGIVRGNFDIDNFDEQAAKNLFVSLKENHPTKNELGWGVFGLTPNGGRKWTTASKLIDEWNNDDQTTAR
jgi:hypothetical protein